MSNADIFDSQDLFIGENKRKGINISVNTGTLSISSVYITIKNATDDSVQAARTAATASGDDVYYYVSTSGYTQGPKYAMIEFKDGDHIGIAKLNFEVL